MDRSRFLHSLPFLEPAQNPLTTIPAAQAQAQASAQAQQDNRNDHPDSDPQESNTLTHSHTIKRDNRSTDVRMTPSTTTTMTMTQHVSCGNVVSLEPIAHPSGQCVGPCFFVPPANNTNNNTMDKQQTESTTTSEVVFDEALCPFRAVIGPPAVHVAASAVAPTNTIHAKPPVYASPQQSSASTTMSTSPALLQSCQKATSASSDKSTAKVDAACIRTGINNGGITTSHCKGTDIVPNLNLYFGFANAFGTNRHLDGNGGDADDDGEVDVHCNWKEMDNDMDIENGNPSTRTCRQEVEFFRVRLDLLRSIHVESSTPSSSSSSSSNNNGTGGIGAQQNQEKEHDANDANDTRHNHHGTIPPSLVFQFDSCMLRTFFHPARAGTGAGAGTTSSVNAKDEIQLQNAFHQMKSFLQTNRNETNLNSSTRTGIVHDHDVIDTGDTNQEINVNVPTTLRKRIRDLNQQPSQLSILSKRMRQVQSDVLFHHPTTTTMLRSLSDSNANDCIYNKCANELQELNQISHDSNANAMEESIRKCRSEQETLELELDSILQGLFPSQSTRRRGRERRRRKSRATTCTGSDDGGGGGSNSNRLLNGTSVTPSTNETGGKAAPVSTLDLEKESSSTNKSTSINQATQKLGQEDGSFNSDRITRMEECIRLYRRAIIEKHDIACLSLR